jgi:hypothetical protein
LAADTMRLSARGYHRVLRVARTLADLDGADKVGRLHLAEALSYRAMAHKIRGQDTESGLAVRSQRGKARQQLASNLYNLFCPI